MERVLREMKEAGGDKGLVLGLRGPITIGIDVPNEDIAKAVKPHAGKLYWGPAVILTDSGAAAAEVEHCIKDLGAVAVGGIGPGYGNFRIDVPILIHAGPVFPQNTRLHYGDLLAMDEVCVSFPEMKIVLCHFGEPHYEEAGHLLAKHPNLYADISMMPFGAGLSSSPNSPPVVYPFPHLDEPFLYYFSTPACNHNKLLWASDVQHPKESMEAFRGVNQRLKQKGWPSIPENLLERLFSENWMQVFTKIK